MIWRFQEAERRLGEVARLALEEGPQVVSRHGGAADFKAFLRAEPDLGRPRVRRDRRRARRVAL